MNRSAAPFLVALLVAILAAAGCRTPGGEDDPEAALPEPKLESVGPPPGEAELANATYTGVFDAPVSLVDGAWEGDPFVPGAASRPSVVLARGFRILTDVDGDGVSEVAVILASSEGGSGTNDFVALVHRGAGGVENVGTAPLGDRVQIRSGRPIAGGLELDVVQAGPDDAMCCPSQKATRSFLLTNDALVEGEPRADGTLSLADLEGVDWRLTHFAMDEAVPENARFSLRVTGGKASGSTPCNRFFAGLEAGAEPGALSMSRIGSTRMACPERAMSLETRYLAALSHVARFGFLTGRLALTLDADGERGPLVYEASSGSSR